MTRILPRSLAVAAVGLATLAVPAVADLGPQVAPDDAKWVLHLDFDALRTSTLGKAILEEAAFHPQMQKLEAVSQVVGIDLLEDLGAATLYGTGFRREDAAILIEVAGQGGNLEGLMLAAPEYASEDVGGRLVHSFIAKDKAQGDARMWVTLDRDAAETTIVAAYDRDVLGAALERVSAAPAAEAAPADGRLLYAKVRDIDPQDAGGAQQHSAILRMIEDLAVTVTERGGRLTAEAEADVLDEARAEQLRQLAQGALAMVLMGDQNDPRVAAMADLASRVQVRREGETVRASLDADAAALVEQLREARP